MELEQLAGNLAADSLVADSLVVDSLVANSLAAGNSFQAVQDRPVSFERQELVTEEAAGIRQAADCTILGLDCIGSRTVDSFLLNKLIAGH